MIRILFIYILLVNQAFAQQSLPAIGGWREQLPYNSAIDVAAGDGKIYCGTPYSLFSVQLSDQSIERMSRVTGLNETGISAIHYNESNKKLFIAYTNSNIDIIHNKNIFNVPGIKRAVTSGDKSIYNIYTRGNDYYLSTGLGIIVINGDRYEVKETWPVGNGGNPVKVNGFTSNVGFYYAATEEGLKKAAVNSANLSDPLSWSLITGNGLSPGPCRNVFAAGDRIFLEKNDSLFVQSGNSWNLFYTDGWNFTATGTSENKIQVCERNASGVGRVVMLDPVGTIYRVLENTGAVSFPRKAILYYNEPWVADQYASLSHFYSGNTYRQYILNSPQSIASGEILYYNDKFIASSGAVNEAWNYQYNGDGIYVYNNGDWNNINRYRYPQLDSLLDFITVAVDKRDGSIWAGSYGGGLLHIKPGNQFEIFKQSYLGETVGDPGSWRVSGLAFDRDNNLWISNYGAAQQLRVRKNNGSWLSFTVPPPLYDNALAQIIIGDNNYKWIVAPLGNGLVCYDHGASIDNPGDDRWKRVAAGAGNGNLPNNEVLCIEKDKNGFIWVGTTDGIGVLECPESVFSAGSCDAVLPLVPNGNFAGYLFKGLEVRHILTDGANRKWVATKNGVFLVSASGEQVILHFTENNSPLLSNDVKKIAIDHKTGEVWFATQKGICSYRGTSTEGNETNEELLVFPNPVPAGYGGTIAIRGLVNNAIVKITELDGRLVYQTRALGGQALWDGRNYRGQRISSGVYLILVNDDGKKEKEAGKIFFMSR